MEKEEREMLETARIQEGELLKWQNSKKYINQGRESDHLKMEQQGMPRK